MKSSTVRIHSLDELRGICLALMVLYHAMYDIYALYNVYIPFFYSAPMRFLQSFFAGVFIMIAGITCSFSRSNFKRGIKTLVCALAVSLSTMLVTPAEPILFGILHLLGVCMVLYPLAAVVLNQLPQTLSALALFLLFAATWLVPSRKVGFFAFPLLDLSPQLYTNFWFAAVGFAPADFVSADYFPLLPWGFLFLAGSRIGHLLAIKGVPAALTVLRFPFWAACGRNSLAVYLLHQPVLIFIFTLVGILRTSLFSS